MNQTVQCFSRSMPGLLEGKSILITDDRMTPDLGDYYVVKPVFEFWKRTAHELNAAKPVPGELSHTSERNSECLSMTHTDVRFL